MYRDTSLGEARGSNDPLPLWLPSTRTELVLPSTSGELVLPSTRTELVLRLELVTSASGLVSFARSAELESYNVRTQQESVKVYGFLTLLNRQAGRSDPPRMYRTNGFPQKSWIQIMY